MGTMTPQPAAGHRFDCPLAVDGRGCGQLHDRCAGHRRDGRPCRVRTRAGDRCCRVHSVIAALCCQCGNVQQVELDLAADEWIGEPVRHNADWLYGRWQRQFPSLEPDLAPPRCIVDRPCPVCGTWTLHAYLRGDEHRDYFETTMHEWDGWAPPIEEA